MSVLFKKDWVKKWTRWSLVGCACSSLLSGCTHGIRSPEQPIAAIPAPTAPQAVIPVQPQIPDKTPMPVASPDPIQDMIQQLTLDEKLGQMIFAGIDGTDRSPQTMELLEAYHVGGLILYKPNIENSKQLIKLVNALKQTNRGNKLPLWLGVDEEGGKVTRLPGDIVKMPPSKEVGKTNQKEFAYGVGNVLGQELSAYGLNVDFAPVLDINSNPNNPVIGDRAFGPVASIVGTMGIQVMKGLQAQQVLPVVKHFPGHGDTSVDSHVGLPVVQHDLARLRKLELLPFAEAFSQQADAVMVAHILLPKVDEQYPASMSKKIITDLLRKEMGFDGLVMTDDMTMGAIATNYELGEAAVLSVLAGSNVVMVAHDYDKVVSVIEALRNAVKENRIRIEMIDQSLARIIHLKYKYQVQDLSPTTPDIQQLNAAANQLLDEYFHK
ncbi:beta-N-acetylhexosaminidase [Paenibacillus agricola]|uniref:beta-N-acetylhexosaminidase n=1 Tax=Paenibacillus agricola TaxID=2716264 RepID=A0ABX0J4C5_9BACL|nr:beta-N-acetylhexosaminidase [Paenibacillus agricola]NHN30498.1 beta-N-acetylhexosaminidase [Paenibacillus agricola]